MPFDINSYNSNEDERTSGLVRKGNMYTSTEDYTKNLSIFHGNKSYNEGYKRAGNTFNRKVSSGEYDRATGKIEDDFIQEDREREITAEQNDFLTDLFNTVGPTVSLTKEERQYCYDNVVRMMANGDDPRPWAEQILTINAVANANGTTRDDVLRNWDEACMKYYGELKPVEFKWGAGIINAIQQGYRQDKSASLANNIKELYRKGYTDDSPEVKEAYDSYKKYQEIIDYNQNRGPRDSMVQKAAGWVDDSVQNAFYMGKGMLLGYVGGVAGGAFMSALGPGGTVLGYEAGSHLARIMSYYGSFGGESFIKMKEAGVSTETALKYSDHEGFLNALNEDLLDSLMDVGTDLTKTGMKKTLEAAGIKTLERKAFIDIGRNAFDVSAKNVMKSNKFWRYFGNYLYYMGTDASGEFLQESTQNLTTDLYVNAAKVADGLSDKGSFEWKDSLKDAADAGVQGFMNGLFFSSILGPVKVRNIIKSDLETTSALKDIASVAPDKASFIHDQDVQELAKNISLNEKAGEMSINDALGNFYDNVQEARKTVAQMTADKSKDGTTVEASGEGQKEITRKDDGRIRTEVSYADTDMDGVEHVKISFGSPIADSVTNKGSSKSYGEMAVDIDKETNTATINRLTVMGDYTYAAQEMVRTAIEDHFGAYDIEWDTNGDEVNEIIKKGLIDSNSKNADLNFRTGDARANERQQLYMEIMANNGTITEEGQDLGHRSMYGMGGVTSSEARMTVSVIEALADKYGMGLKEFVDKEFGGQLLINENDSRYQNMVKNNPNARGFSEAVKSLRGAIYVAQHGDVSTFNHELFHVALRLDSKERNNLVSELKSIFSEDGKIAHLEEYVNDHKTIFGDNKGSEVAESLRTIADIKNANDILSKNFEKAEEDLAKLYEAWLSDKNKNNFVDPKLGGILSKLADAVKKIYRILVDNKVVINPELERAFTSIMGLDAKLSSRQQASAGTSYDENILNAFDENLKKAAPKEESVKKETSEKYVPSDENIKKIRAKYERSHSVYGFKHVMVMPDGTEVNTHYKLVEAEAPTASHNEVTFKSTEGFPVNEKGQNINDRDYYHDKDAQESVRNIAKHYDARAIANPPVVTKDGIVVSGNNRVMSSKLAAEKGTDKTYLSSLKNQLEEKGFQENALDSFKNPRLVLEIDAEHTEAYTTQEFSKYNKDDKKTMSKLNKAISIGKQLSVDDVKDIASNFDDYENLSDLYKDKKETNTILEKLVALGIITSTEKAQYVDENGSLSNIGKDLVETLLLGSVLDENNIRALDRDGVKSIRNKLARIIVPLTNNIGLGDYSISKELNNALDLVINTIMDKTVSNINDYLSQMDLFGDKKSYSDNEVYLAKLLSSKKIGEVEFSRIMKGILSNLEESSSGQMDMFSDAIGGVDSKDDILKKTLEKDSIRYQNDITSAENTEARKQDINKIPLEERMANYETWHKDNVDNINRWIASNEIINLDSEIQAKNEAEESHTRFQQDLNYSPETVGHAYKMFEMDLRDGSLHPLFIENKYIMENGEERLAKKYDSNKNEISIDDYDTPVSSWEKGAYRKGIKQEDLGTWFVADNIPTKGFAKRPGWHLGTGNPVAPWLAGKNGLYNAKRGNNFKRVFCEVSYPMDINYQSELDAIGEKDIKGHTPENGYYLFRESNNSTWVIAGALRIDRILSDAETMNILDSNQATWAEEIADFLNKKYKNGITAADIRANWENEAKKNTIPEGLIGIVESVRYQQNNDSFYIKKKELESDFSNFGSNGEHLAPNGKPSNLSYDQWVQTRTQEFKKWFGDWENDPENASKIVDENGEPKEVYHFSYEKFIEFDPMQARMTADIVGSFFAPNEDDPSYGDNKYSMFLNIKNPAINPKWKPYSSDRAGLEERNKLISEGYDGVINTDSGEVSEYIAFFPNQIKSSNNNKGSFSPSDNRFRYQSALDKEYLEAVNSGDMEKAQRMVDAKALKKGYITSSDYRMAHRAPYKDEDGFNKNMPNAFNGELMPKDALAHPEWYWNMREAGARQSYDSVVNALRRYKRDGHATIKMYRGVVGTVKESQFRNGDWITPSKLYAEGEGASNNGHYKVIEQEVNIEDCWWNADSISEWGYDDGKSYAYKNTANNRKLTDAVTYDDAGNIISLSKRFVISNSDVRYQDAAITIQSLKEEYRNKIGKSFNKQTILKEDEPLVKDIIYKYPKVNLGNGIQMLYGMENNAHELPFNKEYLSAQIARAITNKNLILLPRFMDRMLNEIIEENWFDNYSLSDGISALEADGNTIEFKYVKGKHFASHTNVAVEKADTAFVITVNADNRNIEKYLTNKHLNKESSIYILNVKKGKLDNAYIKKSASYEKLVDGGKIQGSRPDTLNESAYLFINSLIEKLPDVNINDQTRMDYDIYSSKIAEEKRASSNMFTEAYYKAKEQTDEAFGWVDDNVYTSMKKNEYAKSLVDLAESFTDESKDPEKAAGDVTKASIEIIEGINLEKEPREKFLDIAETYTEEPSEPRMQSENTVNTSALNIDIMQGSNETKNKDLIAALKDDSILTEVVDALNNSGRNVGIALTDDMEANRKTIADNAETVRNVLADIYNRDDMRSDLSKLPPLETSTSLVGDKNLTAFNSQERRRLADVVTDKELSDAIRNGTVTDEQIAEAIEKKDAEIAELKKQLASKKGVATRAQNSRDKARKELKEELKNSAKEKKELERQLQKEKALNQKMKERKALAEVREYKKKLAKSLFRKWNPNIDYRTVAPIMLEIRNVLDPKFARQWLYDPINNPNKVAGGETIDLEEAKAMVLGYEKGQLDTNNTGIDKSELRRRIGSKLYDQLAGEGALPLNDWSIKALEDLNERLNEAWAEGRQIREAKLVAQKARRQAIIDEITDTIREMKPYKDNKIKGARGTKAGMQSRFRGIKYSVYRMQELARMLDGVDGAENRGILVDSVRDAQNAETVAVEERMRPVKAVIDSIGEKKVSDFMYQYQYKASWNDDEFTGSELGFIYLSQFNEKAKEAVMYGVLMSEDEIGYTSGHKGMDGKAILKALPGVIVDDQELMDTAEKRYEEVLKVAESKINQAGMMSVVDAISNDLWNPQNGQNLLDYSLDVFNIPVVLEDHYIPLRRLDATGTQAIESTSDVLSMVSGNYLAKVRDGFLTEKQTIAPRHQKPINMDLMGVWANSVQEQEHLRTTGELLSDINAIYERSNEVRDVITRAFGKEMLKEISDYTKYVADPNFNDAKDDVDQNFKIFQGSTAMAYLGFKTSSIINQLVFSPVPFTGEAKMSDLFASYLEFLTNPTNTWDLICDKSVMMKSRSANVMIESIRELKDDPNLKDWQKVINNINEFGMQGLDLVDKYCVGAGWLGVYRTRLNENLSMGMRTEEAEREAIKAADEVVLRTQPNGNKTELARLFRTNKAWVRLLLQFQTSLNTVYNNLITDTKQDWEVYRKGGDSDRRSRMLKRVVGHVVGFALSGILYGYLTEGLKSDDDDENVSTLRVILRHIKWALSQGLQALPVFGSAIYNGVEAMTEGKSKMSLMSFGIFPAVDRSLDGAVKMVVGAQKEDEEKRMEAISKGAIKFGEGMGLFMGIPISAIKQYKKAYEEKSLWPLVGR